jgi:transcriptional regulator with XRE-family HTH domain
MLFADMLRVVDTLSDRVRWILDNTRSPSGEKWSGRALSNAAGLKSSAHVGMIVRGTAVDVKVDTLAAIARAAGVSLEWLSTGHGSPSGPEPSVHASDGEEPRMGALPGWTATVDAARALDSTVPDWAFEELANAHPLVTSAPSPAAVALMARSILSQFPTRESIPRQAKKRKS